MATEKSAVPYPDLLKYDKKLIAHVINCDS